MSLAEDGGIAGRLRALSRRAGALVSRSVGSAARAGRAAGRALTPDAGAIPAPPVVDRLGALAARLAGLEARLGGARGGPLGAHLAAVDALLGEAAALGQSLTGRAAVHPLPECDVAQPGGRVARQVLAALARRTPPAAPAVARAIIGLTHAEPQVRRLALDFLGEPPEPLALPLLEQRYRDGAAAERRAILAVVRRMDSRARGGALVRAALSDADAAVRLNAVGAVAPGGKLPAELDEIAATDPRAEVRLASLRALLGGEAPRRGPRIEQALRDPVARVRLDAVRAAAATGDAGVVLPLLRALVDEELAVRRAAAGAVAKLTGGDLDFDPAAPAAVRRAAVSRLRREWGGTRFRALPGAAADGAAAITAGEDELAHPLDAEFLVEAGAPRSDAEPE